MARLVAGGAGMKAPALHVAVAADLDPYWFDLLMRAGVPVRLLGTCDHGAAVLFLPDRAGLHSRATRALVDRCRQQGLAVVAGAHWGSALLGGRVRRVHATSVCAGVRGLPMTPVRLHGDVEVLATATAGRVWPADIPASTSVAAPAPVLVLPLPAEAPLGGGAHTVTMAVGTHEVAEVVSAADHGALRALCTAALASMAHASGRPFARLAAAPDGFGGTLAIRVDADGGSPAETAAVLASLAQSNQRATWFVDVERQLADGGRAVTAIAAAGHEVQSRFFHQCVYRSARRNRNNLERSIAGLAALGVQATAAAAPSGGWNAGLAAAMRECGLDWSSECTRAHDDVPGTFGGDPARPWQVPVHPVSPGLLLAAGCSDEEVNHYFGALLADRLAAGEPAVFYLHPIGELGRCPGLLPHLDRVATSEALPVWRPTLGELCAFHRARAEQLVECRLGRNTIAGGVDGPAPLLLDQPDGSRLTLRGSIEVARVALPAPVPECRPGPILVPAAPQGKGRRERRFGDSMLALFRRPR
jgi:hypothetical protein